MGAHMNSETPEVTINLVLKNGVSKTDVFVRYFGKTFYTRLNFILADTESNRVQEGQAFLRRLKQFPSEIWGTYEATQERVGKIMSADDLPAHGGSRAKEILALAREGAPPAAKRPALSIVRS